MKTIILIFATTLFVTLVSASQLQSKELSQKLISGSVITDIVGCLTNALQGVAEEDLPAILNEVREVLDRLGLCVNVDVSNVVAGGAILQLLNCLLTQLGNASAEDISKVIAQLKSVLIKVNVSVSCISNILQKFCNISICNALDIVCSLLTPLAFVIDLLIKLLLSPVCSVIKG